MKRIKKKMQRIRKAPHPWGGHVKNPPENCPAKRWQVSEGIKFVDYGLCWQLCGKSGSLDKSRFCAAAKEQSEEATKKRKEALKNQPNKEVGDESP